MGPAPEHPYNPVLRQRWRFLWRYLRRRHDLRRHPPGRHRPLVVRRGASEVSHLARQPLRAGWGGRNARYATGNAGVRRPDDDFRAQPVHALHAQGGRGCARRRTVSLLAPEYRADRDLRHGRGDVRGTAWERGGRCSCGPRTASRCFATRCTASSRTSRTRTISWSACAAARQPNADIETRPHQHTSGPLRDDQLPPGRPEAGDRSKGPRRLSAIPRPWLCSSESIGSLGW